MHDVNYSPSSLPNKGIIYDKSKIIQSGRRILAQEGVVSIEFILPDIEQGNYRFEIEANGKSDQRFYKARDFGIKSSNYPTLKTAEELANPLIYLIGKKDHEDLISIKNQDSLKQAVDSLLAQTYSK